MISKTLLLGAGAFLVAGFVAAPIQLGLQGIEVAVAHAVHGTPDGNNGSGNNRAADGSKRDDDSNRNYGKDNENDGNFDRGDDKKSN